MKAIALMLTVCFALVACDDKAKSTTTSPETDIKDGATKAPPTTPEPVKVAKFQPGAAVYDHPTAGVALGEEFHEFRVRWTADHRVELRDKPMDDGKVVGQYSGKKGEEIPLGKTQQHVLIPFPGEFPADLTQDDMEVFDPLTKKMVKQKVEVKKGDKRYIYSDAGPEGSPGIVGAVNRTNDTFVLFEGDVDKHFKLEDTKTIQFWMEAKSDKGVVGWIKYDPANMKGQMELTEEGKKVNGE